MANELKVGKGALGFPVMLHFSKANIAANTTTVLPISGAAGASDGIPVPTGYVFKPLYLSLESNADYTAGTLTGKVTADGTALVGGPEPVMSDTVQAHSAVARAGASNGVAAGAMVGVSVVASAALAPETTEVDAFLIGVLQPV